MKITRKKLEKIIREETTRVLAQIKEHTKKQDHANSVYGSFKSLVARVATLEQAATVAGWDLEANEYFIPED